MRRAALIIVLLLLPGVAIAAGWSDYELEIGGGYKICKFSPDAVYREGRGTVLFMEDYPVVYPSIEAYAMTVAHILIQCRRRAPDGQVARKAFFIVAKDDASVIGPLSGEEFDGHAIVREAATLSWTQPRHPHPWLPFLLLLGGFMGSYVPLILVLIAGTLFVVIITFIRQAHKIGPAHNNGRSPAEGKR